jgi:branched-subunit amino acid aminotransferase/4-amino-4-deoxychorismate lyase
MASEHARMRRVLVNGVEGAGLPGDDPGFTRGLNVFETLRSYGRQLFRLEQHLSRLTASAATLQIPTPARDVLRNEVELLAANGTDLVIRIALTAGGNRVTSAEPMDPTRIGAPIRVATVEMEPPSFLPGTVKHGSRAAWVVACQRLDVDEIMFVDRSGKVLECNRSNVFAVDGDRLCTPALDGGLLAGVTRGALLEAAREQGVEIDVGALRRDAAFTELYVSSTLKELAPVIELDGEQLTGWGTTGRAVYSGLRKIIARECGTKT